MYEDQTFDVILQRMLSRVPETMDKRESSPIYAALAPAAVELTSMYIAFDCMLAETFGDTASREYLIRLCADRGITPKKATQAVLELETDVEIADGKRFTGGGNTYIVTAPGQVTCEQIGTVGNEYTGDVLPIEYISGLTTAKITRVLIYGEAEESTESLRQRYFESFEERAFSGNVKDYRNKTLALAGVGAVKVVRTWNGPGTVKLVILDSAHGKATDTLISAVQKEFDPNGDGMGDGLAPIGHVVTVETAKESVVNIATNITFDSGYGLNECKALIEDAMKKYILSLRQDWENQNHLIVRIASLDAAIMGVKGVLDVTGTTINGGTQNLELTEYEIPVMGVVTYGG